MPQYSGLYAFGDGLSDAGNRSSGFFLIGLGMEVLQPPYAQETYGTRTTGVFSNGPVWVQDLSLSLGIGNLTPSQLGGTDYAFGEAETGPTPQNHMFVDVSYGAIALPAQIDGFLSSGQSAANALVSVWNGSNDILDILANPNLTALQQATDISAAVANEITGIDRLVAGGARHLLVVDVPDLGKTPEVIEGLADNSNTPSTALDALASQLSADYNTQLTAGLAQIASAGTADVHLVDAYAVLNNAIANPASYGLTNVTTPVWSGSYDGTEGTLAATTLAEQSKYLFFDHLYPTETGHEIITAAAEQALASDGPAGLAVADTTTGQALTPGGLAYIGPVAGVDSQYINITPDSLNISAGSAGWFIHGGSGNDAIAVTRGTNVLDGGTGSNFLSGGSGTDTFFVDDRAAAADIWSTVVDFHAGDAATIWGVTASAFALDWTDGQGAAGYTGLTLHGTEAGGATVSLTLAGLSRTALADGQISTSFGNDPASGSAYLYIHANG